MRPEDAAEIMKSFRIKRIAHRTAGDARDELFQKLLSGGGERIIALVGPSAVGKSTVLTRVQEKLIEHHRAEIEADPGFIPFVSISTVTGLDGNFSWRDGFARLLNATAEPLVGKKLKDSKLILHLDGVEITNTRGLVKDEIRRAFESMVKNRKIRYVFLDEGSAMFDAAVNRNLVRQFNILKSLCVSLGIAIVVAGAYDLLGFIDGTGQLIRRTEAIHMRRYILNKSPIAEGESTTQRDFDGEGTLLLGLDHFSKALNSLLSIVPVMFDDNLFDDKPYFLMKSVGCVGNLHNWLDRGCTHALIHNGGTLTKEIMECTALSNKKVHRLLTEAMLGEEQMHDIPDHEIAALYDVESLKVPESSKLEKSTGKKKHNRSVGQRGPSRDAIGELHV